MVTHKSGFHQNISSLDPRVVEKAIKKHDQASVADRAIRFNIKHFIKTKSQKVLEHALAPYSGTIPISSEQAISDKEKRKATKKAMRSRRR